MIDIGDMQEFDKAGHSAGPSAGVLAHETKEQQLKAESGEVKGVNPAGAIYMHKQATYADDSVNGNCRMQNYLNGDNIFYARDGSKTSQTVTPNSSGGINLTKTKIP
ncbi:hypothetical protein AMR72_16590 [Flavobacterium psychrophilum]|nr:hypothetical protein AMR72_16590 [Flavobacterium psychrophilum]AOE53976.1 hypothetical protein ALW18_16580 [Flavobacterium psychrophilum]